MRNELRTRLLGNAWLPADYLRFLHVGFGDDEILDTGTQFHIRFAHRASMQKRSSYKDLAMGKTSKAQPPPPCSEHPIGRLTLPTQ